MYADEVTDSMYNAIKETNRRRDIQEKYNIENNIVPMTIKKDIRDIIKIKKVYEEKSKYDITKEDDIKKVIEKLTEEMIQKAKDLNFEEAADIRDKIKDLEAMI